VPNFVIVGFLVFALLRDNGELTFFVALKFGMGKSSFFCAWKTLILRLPLSIIVWLEWKESVNPFELRTLSLNTRR